MEALARRSIRDLADDIKTLKLSPVAVLETVADRIERLNSKINCYITFDREYALRQARDAEAEISSGQYKGPLHGIPIAVKDLFDTKDLKTTYGSSIFKNHIPTRDATSVKRLRSSGAVIVGKLNLHELAFGSTNENKYYGPCRNPWDLERIAGGSSGGPAAAVAASLCYGSLGTDSGGSVRVPAALCGCVGLKPTYGRVSRHGALPLSYSLDHVGPMARTVEDVAILLESISGFDPNDPTSSKLPVPNFASNLSTDLAGMKIGILEEFSNPRLDLLDDEVFDAFEDAVSLLEGLGASVEKVRADWIKRARVPNLVIIHVESQSLWEKLKPKANKLGYDVRLMFEFGELLRGTDYLHSQQIRTVITQRMRKLFETYDALLNPTTPTPAPKIGEKTVAIRGKKEISTQEVVSRFTALYDLTGLPALSVPCGFTKAGLPIGLQIGGKAFDESTILKVGHAYEQKTDWHNRVPPV